MAQSRAKNPNHIANPEFCIEADWTLPAGAWPFRRNKSQNSKWRSEPDLDWKGYYLLTVLLFLKSSRLGFSPIR